MFLEMNLITYIYVFNRLGLRISKWNYNKELKNASFFVFFCVILNLLTFFVVVEIILRQYNNKLIINEKRWWKRKKINCKFENEIV